MLFCFDRLMQTIRITAAWHNTSCKFINDQDFVIFYYIVLIAEHQVVGTKCKDDIVLDLQIFRISQVINVEVFLYLLDALFSQVDYFIFFVYYEVTGLFDLFTHDGIDLGEFLGNSTTL